MVNVTSANFGTFTDPKTNTQQDVIKYTLTNESGLEVQILNYGATISAIKFPDNNGKVDDIVLGYDTFQEYLASNNPYFGALVGRVANRIGGAEFFLNGKKIKVTANRPPFQLHGGQRGFDKVIWNSRVEGTRLVLTHLSPDGDEGYPGNLLVTAIYSISEEGSLKLQMSAVTTHPTIVNLTNHSYFNLAGNGSGKVAIYEHLLSVNADKYTITDKDSIPTGELAPVGGTLWDLRIPRRLGDVIPLVPGGGYDQNLCITQGSQQGLTFFARVVHPGSNRSMEVYSDQPGVQLYTANYFPKDTSQNKPGELSVVSVPLIGKNGKNYYQHGAFCLETQNFPDAINHDNFPNSILLPGDVYKHTVVYKFGIFGESNQNINQKNIYTIDAEP